jgi:hypothetical protein
VTDAACVPPETTLVPWGWTEELSRWGTRNGWRCDAPEPAAVGKANSREFSSSLEREWSVGLPDARTIRNLQDFHDAVETNVRPDAAWVVKANFGMSARERILGRGAPATTQAMQWVQKQLAENEAVYFEPWVERIEEVGLQFTVPKEGEPLLEGITPLLTDPLGTYRGSRFRAVSCQLARSDEFAAVLDIVTRAAQRIQRLGYFGPLGIDAMRYRTADGESRWRPLQDINARLTMGRLALGLKRIVPGSRHATWLHFRRGQKKSGSAESADSDFDPPLRETNLIRTSPMIVGGKLNSRFSFCCTAPTAEALHTVETFCLNHKAEG